MGLNKKLKVLRIKNAMDKEYVKGVQVGRTFAYDMACIALGRMSEEHREEFFSEFLKQMKQAELDYGELFAEDSKDDAELWYTGAKIDKEIQDYVGNNFEPFKSRYEFI